MRALFGGDGRRGGGLERGGGAGEIAHLLEDGGHLEVEREVRRRELDGVGEEGERVVHQAGLDGALGGAERRVAASDGRWVRSMSWRSASSASVCWFWARACAAVWRRAQMPRGSWR